MWKAILAWLASLAADPVALEYETPRAAAAVAVAYSQFANEAPTPKPPKPPAPAPDKKCQSCGGRGYIVHADGHRTDCPNCDTFERMTCPDGKCPLPKNVLR